MHDSCTCYTHMVANQGQVRMQFHAWYNKLLCLIIAIEQLHGMSVMHGRSSNGSNETQRDGIDARAWMM